jgi:hypothetical protein
MESTKEKNLEAIVAVLIAIAAVMGAVVAWRASVVSDASGDADYAGLRSALFAEETRALNAVNGYEHYGAYTNYARYNAMGASLEGYLAENVDLEENEAYLLDRQRSEYYDLADASNDLFPARYMNRDGSYGLNREMGEMWADAAKEKDLNPDPQFKEADHLRDKSNNMLLTLTLIGISLVFYTLVETVSDRFKYLMVGLGSVFLVVGTVAAIILEMAK